MDYINSYKSERSSYGIAAEGGKNGEGAAENPRMAFCK